MELRENSIDLLNLLLVVIGWGLWLFIAILPVKIVLLMSNILHKYLEPYISKYKIVYITAMFSISLFLIFLLFVTSLLTSLILDFGYVGLIFTFILCQLILLFWWFVDFRYISYKHETKSGNKDMRYKNNKVYFSDTWKWSLNLLLYTIILLILIWLKFDIDFKNILQLAKEWAPIDFNYPVKLWSEWTK